MVPRRLTLLLVAGVVVARGRASEVGTEARSLPLLRAGRPGNTTLSDASSEDEAEQASLTERVCKMAFDVSGGTLEISPYAGLLGCTMAYFACWLDATVFPLLMNPWMLWVHVLLHLQSDVLLLMERTEDYASEFLRNLGKSGVIFQLYYANQPGQLHELVFDYAGFDMRLYVTLFSIGFVFLDVSIHGLFLHIQRKCRGTAKGAKDFTEMTIISEVEEWGKCWEKKQAKAGGAPGAAESRFSPRYICWSGAEGGKEEKSERGGDARGGGHGEKGWCPDGLSTCDHRFTFECAHDDVISGLSQAHVSSASGSAGLAAMQETSNQNVSYSSSGSSVTWQDMKYIILHVEHKRAKNSADASREEHVQWPVILRKDAECDGGFVVRAYVPKTFVSGAGHTRERPTHLEFKKDDLLMYYKDHNADKPFQNVYMCVPKRFVGCLQFFFVQCGLMMYYMYYLNNDDETKQTTKVSVLKWMIGLVITSVVGEAEAGSTFQWLYWRRMWVNLRDDRTHPKMSWRIWFDWRLRELFDFFVNCVCRAIILGTAPILLCTEEPIEFIKDVLAMFFIVKLDELDKSWTDPDVVEEAALSKFIELKEEESRQLHVRERHVRKNLYECGVNLMYLSPDEEHVMDVFENCVAQMCKKVSETLKSWYTRGCAATPSGPRDMKSGLGATQTLKLSRPFEASRDRLGKLTGGGGPLPRLQPLLHECSNR